ncbi:MAG: ribosome small subunit-dependent GTPase A [Propionivibrio sp.]
MRAGTIVAAHGRQYLVETDDGARLLCFPRGKRSEMSCGDRVGIEPAGDGQGVIEAVAPRSTFLYRSNEFRQKLIAANATQIVIVVATEPSFSDELITRAIVAAEAQDMKVVIVLNKCDLTERLDYALQTLKPFADLGYTLLRLTARTGADALLPYLAEQSSVLVGQSGMGKSTLINALVPGSNARTREISTALDTGKHTTTQATLYRLDRRSALIDSPGLQEFGLHHLPLEAIATGFRELRSLHGKCRFRDCRHDLEPGCAVLAAVASGAIDRRRYAVFRSLCKEVG